MGLNHSIAFQTSDFSPLPPQLTMSVNKSYDTNDPVKNYCLAHSSPLHPVQVKLNQETMKHSRYRMLGAPEVISMNALLIKSLGGKKVLDIGVYTGASSLGAALALPDDGIVHALDVSEEFTSIGKPFWKEAGVEHKIKLTIAPAAESLTKLVEAGEENTFDFAIIDADKTGYDTYYELCLKLMRKGGIVAFDNTLQGGKSYRRRSRRSTSWPSGASMTS